MDSVLLADALVTLEMRLGAALTSSRWRDMLHAAGRSDDARRAGEAGTTSSIRWLMHERTV